MLTDWRASARSKLLFKRVRIRIAVVHPFFFPDGTGALPAC
jgi:hypothetical protein